VFPALLAAARSTGNSGLGLPTGRASCPPASPRSPYHQLYVPILLWLARDSHTATHGPLVAGINAPPGAGKSTLVAPHFALADLACVRSGSRSTTSTCRMRSRRSSLRQHRDTPTVRYRGYPGYARRPGSAQPRRRTARVGETGEVRLPVYDNLFMGDGATACPSAVAAVSGPIDLVLLEVDARLSTRRRRSASPRPPLLE